MRLFRTVLLLMLFASAVPAAVLGWLLASASRDQLVRDAVDLAAERVERLRLQAAGYLAAEARATEEVARSTRWSELDPAERRRVLSGLLARRPEVAIATAYDRAGQKLEGLQVFPDRVAPGEVAEHEARAAALMAGAGGAPAVRWSPAYLPAGRREAVITLAVPLADPAVGTLAAEVSLAPLQELAGRARVESRGTVYVIDGSGRYLAHPDAGRVLAAATDDPLAAEVARALAGPAELQGARVAELRDGRGQDLLGAYAVVPEVGWGVVAAQPRADAFASVERMRRTAIAGAAISLFLAVVISAGFARSITRPIGQCVRGALEIARGHFGRRVDVSVRNEIGELAHTFNHMSRELATYDAENHRLIAALETGYLDTIRSLAGAIDAKDPYTRGHSQRVAELAVEVGREMKLDAPQLKALEYGGLLHDVGKIGIPEQLLRKKSFLTAEEMRVMRQHPVIGAEIVKGVDFLRDALPAIRCHHERWDGTGYPDGLAAETIPLVARIVNAADTWDACTSSRPYQAAMEPTEVVAILARLRGTQIDPAVHDALLAVLHRSSGAVIGLARSA